MNKTKTTPVQLRKRRMMLVAPLLTLPFLTLAFRVLGGGKAPATAPSSSLPGLNLHLPDPTLKKETLLDKLGFYDKAEKDSLQLKEEMRNDPYYQEQFNAPVSNELEKIVQSSAGKFHQSSLTGENKLNASPYPANSTQAEEKLMQKLSELNKAIQEKPDDGSQEAETRFEPAYNEAGAMNTETQRLQTMMQSMNQKNDSDPELDKLSGMMDKIIAIQHPEKIKEQIKQPSSQQNEIIFSVSNQSIDDTMVNGFYSLDASVETIHSNAIEAVVNEDQALVTGSIIKLRLLHDAFIRDIKIPAGNFVFGIVSLAGERLQVAIPSIRYGAALYPVKMEVYDMDGISGIYIPGAIGRDAAKQSADNSLQTMQLSSLDPSLTAQATAAGINTVKTMLSKKVKLVKVTVKAGYKILLKDKSSF